MSGADKGAAEEWAKLTVKGNYDFMLAKAAHEAGQEHTAAERDRLREVNAEMLVALKAIRSAIKDNEEMVRVQADFIGSIIFGSAAEKVDAAIDKAEAIR